MKSQTAATDELTAIIHWESDSTYSDDSEPLTGKVVGDEKGLITILEQPGLLHRIEKASDGETLIVRSMTHKDQRKRDTNIKGRVTNVEVEK